MKILCGTDFSKPAMEAANAAAALAVRANETLVLVHVVDEPGGEALSGKLLASRRAKEREILGREAARLRKRGAKVQETLLAGTPDEALVRFARKAGAQLIVVSSLGRRPSARWLLGSVAERTAQSSPVPTLVVRSAGPFVLGAFKQRKLKVLMGVDFSVTSDAALAWLKDFSNLADCELVTAHLNWPPEEHERLGVHGQVSFTENLPEVRGVLERDVRERVSRLTGREDFRVRVEVTWGRNDTRLIDLAREEKADLIVVGTHQRHGLDRIWQGSVSRGLLHNAPMSVVCVPMTEGPRARPGAIPRLRRVLVTTDFSRLGNLAIPHACSMVGPGGDVRLVHVVHPRALPGNTYHQGLGASPRHVRFVTQCRRKLLALVPQEAEALGILIEVEVIESEDAPKAICQAARRTGADVICLSSHGHTGISKVLLGSVAQAVMTQSRRPLLVVREPKT